MSATGCLVREASQQPEHDLEHPRLRDAGARSAVAAAGRRRWRAEVGQQVRELQRARADELVQPLTRQRADQRPQGTDERSVRQAGLAELQAVPDQDVRARRPGAGHELADEAGLADARVAADQARRRPMVRRQLERVGESFELDAAPNEDRAAHAGHGRDDSHRSPPNRARPSSGGDEGIAQPAAMAADQRTGRQLAAPDVAAISAPEYPCALSRTRPARRRQVSQPPGEAPRLALDELILGDGTTSRASSGARRRATPVTRAGGEVDPTRKSHARSGGRRPAASSVRSRRRSRGADPRGRIAGVGGEVAAQGTRDPYAVAAGWPTRRPSPPGRVTRPGRRASPRAIPMPGGYG